MRTLIFLFACRSPDEAPPAGSDPADPWEPPTFPGDGLPPSEDTAHGRRTPVDTGTPGDTGTPIDTGSPGGGGDAPSILIADALFAWYDFGEYGAFGYLALLTATSTCGDVFSGLAIPDGIFAYLIGDATHLSDGWAGHWADCGAPPCADLSYALGGEFGYLDGDVTIHSYDPHYLTVDWTTAAGSGQSLTLYNCGDGLIWD